MNIVYHGSPNSNLKEIVAHKSTHQKECIYATDNKVVALLFMGRGNGDLDTRISNINGKPELVERREGVLKKLYDKEGYLYELDGSSFNHYGYLWTLEVISFEKSIIPLRKTFYSNILETLKEEEQKGNIIIYRYPDRPSNIPLDNSDLIDKYIGFENQGITGAIDKLIQIYPEFTSLVQDKIGKIKNKK